MVLLLFQNNEQTLMFLVSISFKISSNSYSLHKQKLFGFLIIFEYEEVLRLKCKITGQIIWVLKYSSFVFSCDLFRPILPPEPMLSSLFWLLRVCPHSSDFLLENIALSNDAPNNCPQENLSQEREPYSAGAASSDCRQWWCSIPGMLISDAPVWQ